MLNWNLLSLEFIKQFVDVNTTDMERASSPMLQLHAPTLVQPPKSRGRPRASYAQTGEFDLGLIREYRSRPALYDRNNKRFKDKVYCAQQWMQMSHKLGYEVSTLRERMITLRNRYNIEKRRLENLSSTSGTPMVSQWPLYENLSFLSEHIRSRRSYKMMHKLENPHEDDDDEEPFDVDDMHSELNGHAKRIKHEQEHDYDDGEIYDCDRQLPVTTVLNIPHNTQILSQEDYSSQLNGSDTLNGESDHLDGLHQPELVLAAAKHKRMQSMHAAGQAISRRRLNAATSSGVAALKPELEESAMSAGATSSANPKYKAFGEFMSHVLTELPSSTSMRLIASFSNELTQATIAYELSQQQPQQLPTQQQQQKQQQKRGSADQQPSSMDETDE
ncbi:uncharacterized protein LOC117575123 isoform X1 [Drosophila albomicans]|uniref:Uncharacterized protein LOC117575123 isoform X1 n=2 Tax=Drosophila albomicans TaxID=7291 RepID=A0A6P8XPP9_DROAB|nr:uncharacterized protein LOC117575123 isoform X1 [Drosophila albomicans]